MADSGSEWGRYAFTGVAALFVGAVFSVHAGRGLLGLACIFAAVVVAIIWFVTLWIDSRRRDAAHRTTTASDEARQLARAQKKGRLAYDLHVDYGD